MSWVGLKSSEPEGSASHKEKCEEEVSVPNHAPVFARKPTKGALGSHKIRHAPLSVWKWFGKERKMSLALHHSLFGANRKAFIHGTAYDSTCAAQDSERTLTDLSMNRGALCCSDRTGTITQQ